MRTAGPSRIVVCVLGALLAMAGLSPSPAQGAKKTTKKSAAKATSSKDGSSKAAAARKKSNKKAVVTLGSLRRSKLERERIRAKKSKALKNVSRAGPWLICRPCASIRS